MMARRTRFFVMRVTLACSAGLLVAQSACLFKKARLASAPDDVRDTRRKWQEKWTAGQEWLRKKYSTEDHRAIIDRVFAQAFEQLNNPKSLLGAKTQVFILNSLPGTGKTQFVSDIARALDVTGGFSYKELGESDRFIDSTPFIGSAIDAQELDNPSYTVLPRIVMFDEYTHAVPLISVDLGAEQTGVEKQKDSLLRQMKDLDALINTLRNYYNALDAKMRGTSDAYAQNDYQSERQQIANQIQELRALSDVYKTQYNDFSNRINALAKASEGATAEQRKAVESLKILWGALGSGSFQTAANEAERRRIQEELRNLNYQITEHRRRLTIQSLRSTNLRTDLETLKATLLEQFEQSKSSQLTAWRAERERLINEAREAYDKNFEKRLADWRKAAADIGQSQASDGIGAQNRPGLDTSGSLYGPGAPPAQARANLASAREPVYDFQQPDDLPERPVFEEDLIFLGNNQKFRTASSLLENSEASENSLRDSIVATISSSTRLLSQYIEVYPRALGRFENDGSSAGGINIDQIVRTNLLREAGIREFGFQASAEVEDLINQARQDWSNLSPVMRMSEIFAASPSRFFQINDDEIAKQVNATNFLTGHINLFLASNVFHVQNEAAKLFPTPDTTYPICDSEQVRAARGPWPKLPDYRDPECLRVLVKAIAETPEAKQAMTDALYSIFGSKIELFNKNIPALQSRLGGAPFFFPPPGSKDYGNFVDFELERVRSTVAGAAENYRDSEGFVAPEIEFSDGLKEKLYQDQIDANAGYRGLQGAISSVVFGAVNQEVTVDLLSSFRSRAAADGQVNVRKRSPRLPKKIVFDYNGEKNAISVFYDAQQKAKRTIGARLLSQSESKLLRKKNDAFFSNQLSAIWLAGEITLTSLLFESLPGIDVSFVVDTKGVQERAKQEIPEWSLDASNNWPAEADNILAHFAGGASMIAIAPYVGVLPESESRFAIAETLIANLHKKLREEALKTVGPESNDEKLEGAKDLIGRLGSGYLKEHPVYRVLLKFVKNRELSQEQIAEVQQASLRYMVQYALDHQALIEFVSKRFLDIVQDANTVSGITPQDVIGAFRSANDLVASGNLLQLEVLNKLERSATGVTLGRYNRRELLADMSGLRLDTTDDGVSSRAHNWFLTNPLAIFFGMGDKLRTLSKSVSD